MLDREFTKRELELIARACLHLAAKETTEDEDMDILDTLCDYFETTADEMVEEW